MKIKLFLALFIFFSIDIFAADILNLSSPDKQIAFNLFQKNGSLQFSVTHGNNFIINTSPFIVTIDNKSVTTNIRLLKSELYEENNSYEIFGAHKFATNRFKGAVLTFQQNKYSFKIDIRVFNDGVAFRTILPGKQNDKRVPDEATSFNLPDNAAIWYHGLNMHYEDTYNKKKVGEMAPGEWAAPPVTFKLKEGVYAAITEGNLEDYSGMALQVKTPNSLQLRLAHHQPTSYPYKLRYSPEDTLRLSKPAALSGTITTPWRVVIIGKDLNTMVNNDIVTNLCPPPDKKLFPQGIHTDWIKPGRAVWKYLDGGGDGTLEVMKHFTDGAAALGFEYNILEGFWPRWASGELKELVDYSGKKGVGIWLWKHSKSLRDKASRDSFFTVCSEAGVKGAKIDFFDHEAKEVIDLYKDISTEAAKHKILLNFHGANKPTGLSRTYPNELIREAVRGMEASRLEDRATHETTIPFTRWVVGPAEYTVLHFGDRRKNTSRVHQIASAVILNAPLLTYAAHPDSLLSNPAAAVIKNIPAVWDETIVLPPSEIGEIAVFARRKGSTWFLAVMNGLNPTTIKVPLNFLKEKTNGTCVYDAPGSVADTKIIKQNYSPTESIEINLASGGGFVAQFEKIN